MTLFYLALRNMRHAKGLTLAAATGLAVAGAALTGSLLAGASARAALRETALARLGRADTALTGTEYFRANLAEELARETETTVAAAILLPGSLRQADTGVTVAGATVAGVDDGFSAFFDNAPLELSGRAAAINERLARDLNAQEGDTLLIAARRDGAAPADSLFGRRERGHTLAAMRVTVARIVPDTGAGGFSLAREPDAPRTVFLCRTWLADRIGRAAMANTLLAQADGAIAGSGKDVLSQAFGRQAALSDWGVEMKPGERGDHVRVTGAGLTMSAAQIEAVSAAARDAGSLADRVSVYLANELATERGRKLAYAMVAGLERPAVLVGDGLPETLADGDIVLNAWAARLLDAQAGDRASLTHFLVTGDGTWPEKKRVFTVRGVAAMEGPGAEPELVPEFEGLTQAERMGDWDAPFPVDFDRITTEDEEYWRDWRAAPKAFVGLETMRRLWQGEGTAGAVGRDWITSLRVPVPDGEETAAFAARFEDALRVRLAERAPGRAFEPVRMQALAAADGAQDLAGLFVGMSVFVLAAGLGLAAMLMRLALAARARQTGLLLACGYAPGAVGRLIAMEGAVLAALGMAGSLPLALGYAAWLARGLGDTAGVTIRARVDIVALLAGLGLAWTTGFLAMISVARALKRKTALELLAGWQHASATVPRHGARRGFALAVACLAGAAAALGMATAGILSDTAAFFSAGMALLTAGLCAANGELIRLLRRPGRAATTFALAVRSLAANRGRTLTVAGLFAAASFLWVAVAANRRDYSAADAGRLDSGTGGFALQALSGLPVPYDFGTAAGRDRLGFEPEDETAFADVRVYGLLSNAGDDASCLNPAAALNPRLAGAGSALIERGGFRVRLDAEFAARLTGENPWRVLEQETDDGAIPVFGDADSVLWQLGSGLGRTIEATAEDGAPVRLRVAGLLTGSILASELIMAESRFRALFPSENLPRHFLIETPPDRERAVAELLRQRLGERGLVVQTTRERLNALTAVQNAYMTLFMAVGALGAGLGVFGLGVLLLRAALERRAEFALMRAIGFRRSDLIRQLTLEHALAFGFGLALGTGSALLATLPALQAAETAVSVGTFAAWPLSLGMLGLAVCAAAAAFVAQGAPIPVLRND